jgi:hypothetical protein
MSRATGCSDRDAAPQYAAAPCSVSGLPLLLQRLTRVWISVSVIFVTMLCAGVAPAGAQTPSTPTTSSATNTAPGGGASVVTTSHPFAFILLVTGIPALLWFSLIFYERVSTNRWRKNEYSGFIRTLLEEARPTPESPRLSGGDIEALVRAMNQSPKGATGLTRTILAVGLLTLIGIALTALLIGNPTAQGDLLKTLVTALATAFATVLGFYFGAKTASESASSRGTDATSGFWLTRTTSPRMPGVPMNVSAAPGDGAAVVGFDEPAQPGDAVTYTVTANPGGATATGKGSPIQVLGLTNGSEYTLTVQARNAAGAGPESDASAAVTPTAPT